LYVCVVCFLLKKALGQVPELEPIAGASTSNSASRAPRTRPPPHNAVGPMFVSRPSVPIQPVRAYPAIQMTGFDQNTADRRQARTRRSTVGVTAAPSSRIPTANKRRNTMSHNPPVHTPVTMARGRGEPPYADSAVVGITVFLLTLKETTISVVFIRFRGCNFRPSGKKAANVKRASDAIVTSPFTFRMKIRDSTTKSELIAEVVKDLPQIKPFICDQIDPTRSDSIPMSILTKDSNGEWRDIFVCVCCYFNQI
jgi:hypothetical protein